MTLIFCVGVGIFMLALSFAAVPLYRIFCQKTGYGGTPKISYSSSGKLGKRRISVYFNGDTHRDLPWTFKPLQQRITVQTGATGLAFYRVQNHSQLPVKGMATYNVTPDKAAPYFNKIECFCFEVQTLPAKTYMELPVQFYIDPAFDTDPAMADVQEITLSYTFFKQK